MPLKAIQKILQQAIGLDVASIGDQTFRRAVASRLTALSLSPGDYLGYLQEAPAEIQDLIEAVVIPETWFFREPRAFAKTAEIAGDWLAAHPTGVLRLLSVPCSTGEEPYSMAMALLDGGLDSARFRIDAVDISERAIEHAKRGVYGRNSFRGTNLAFRAHHFDATPEGHHLSETVRKRVRFVRANLLDPAFIPGLELYEIIFCRNMLIYFDNVARDAAVSVLNRLLSNNGTIFVGPSESGLMLDHGLAPVKAPFAFAFAFNKASAMPTVRSIPPVMKAAPAPQHPTPRRRKPIVGSLGPSPKVDQAPDLEDIRRIADQNQLEEAGRACEAYLREGEPSADALLLLGLIRDAAGASAEAVKYYRKVLYLDPSHAQALLHLALLLEKEGDAAGAKIINDRLGRRRV